jgi:hypothetical protein
VHNSAPHTCLSTRHTGAAHRPDLPTTESSRGCFSCQPLKVRRNVKSKCRFLLKKKKQNSRRQSDVEPTILYRSLSWNLGVAAPLPSTPAPAPYYLTPCPGQLH